MMETVTVCNRCGSQECVGKELCQYDGLPHETAHIPKWKLDRQDALAKRATRANPEARRRR